MFLPLCCSYETVGKRINTPLNVLEPPKKIVCVHCDEINETFYKKNDKFLNFCYCFHVPYGTSPAYLACKKCEEQLQIYDSIHKCENCELESGIKMKYCQECGKKQ